MHATPEPHWHGNMLDGHCALYLPDDQRLVDATVEQYREISRLKMGPIVARKGIQLGSGYISAGSSMPPGAQHVLRRADLTLLYTVATEEATRVILDHPAVTEVIAAHRRAGINLASMTLAFLRQHPVTRTLDFSAYPRVAALLAAIGDHPADTDDVGDWRFAVKTADGETRNLRLDEIPVPDLLTQAGNEDDTPEMKGSQPGPASPTRSKGILRGAFRRDRAAPPGGHAPAARSASRINRGDLQDGIPVRGGVRLRIARPGDVGEAARLLQMAGLDFFPPYVTRAIESRDIGTTILRGLSSGHDEIQHALDLALQAGDPNEAVPGLTTLLVASNPGRGLCGALLTMPPASVLAQVAGAGVPVLSALHGMAVLAKIQALAVDENNRRGGLGTALVSTCMAMYFQVGYQLAYGQFRTGSGLEHYYRGLGFSILDPGKGISLSERLGLPIGLAPETGEQFFLRWRN